MLIKKWVLQNRKNMKVPKTFISEKNLEDYTERLLNKGPKKKIDDFKPAVERSELERVLELFDTEYSRAFSEEHLWENIDRLVEKSDYKLISQKLKSKYWSRPSPYNTKESFIFIKNFKTNGNPCYSFAIVENDKLEEFCKRFEKERSIINGHKTVYGPLAKGAIIGGALGLIADYAIARAIGSSNSFTSAGICSLGVMFGFFYGAFVIKYFQKKNKEKLNKNYKCLMTSSNTASKDVIRSAFS